MRFSFDSKVICIKSIQVQAGVFFETGKVYPCSLDEEWELIGPGVLVKHPNIENGLCLDSWFFCWDSSKKKEAFPCFHDYFVIQEELEKKIFEPLGFDLFEIDHSCKFKDAIKNIYLSIKNVNKKTHYQMKSDLKSIKNICEKLLQEEK